MIIMYHSSSCLDRQQKHLVRKERRRQKRHATRQEAVQRQWKKAEDNIVGFMQQRLGVLHSANLQVIVFELALTPQVTHGISLRQSDTRSYLELMTRVVRTMIAEGRLFLYEDESEAILGLPCKQPAVQPRATPRVIVKSDPEDDWGMIYIIKCSHAIRRTLAEY